MMAARKSGSLLPRQGDVVFRGVEAVTGPVRTREAVRQEAIATNKVGTLSRGDVGLY